MATVSLGDGNDAIGPRETEYGYGAQDSSVSLGPLLRQVLSIARRNLWLIVAIIGIFLVVAVVVTMLTTPKFTAGASLEISDRSEQVLGNELDQNTQQYDAYDADRFLNTQVNILQSRALAARVADRLNLYSDPRFFRAMQVNEEDFQNVTQRRNAVLDLLMRNLDTVLQEDTRIVAVRFTSTDAAMSAAIANAYATEFIQANLQRKFDSSSYARNFVQQQLGQARARLEASEQNLNAYAREAGLIRTRDPSANTDGSTSSTSNSVTASSLLQLNQSANQAKAQRIAAEARWHAEQSQPLLSSPAALASPVVQDLQKRRSELQAALDTARGRYLGDHPTVVNLASQLHDMDVQLNRAATEARNSVRADYVAAQAAESSLRSQVKGLEGATLQEQDRSVRYNTLAREADTNRSIYDGLLQRFRELNASAGITASNVSVIDDADPPTAPSSPNPFLNLTIALFLGTLTAAGVVFLKDQLDDRVRVPEEIEEKVGLHLLGVVPDVKDEDPIEALRDPKSMVSESYNALRSSLLYSTRDGLPQLMLVTSAQASEGKSTTSYAIARGMALVGKRSLIIDGDLRRPSIHHLSGVSNKVGLSDILVGEKTAEQAVVPGEVDNFFVLPSGPVPPSPAELLSSPRLLELFQTLRQRFDVIVIDSAPVLGLADSPGLSALADGVLLIIESNRGRGGQLKAAVRRLHLMKPTILGAVLTKFDPAAAGNAYSTYYQYDYYRYRYDEPAGNG
jgi:capsular exopolysaccharide synthesis family protein